MDNINYDYDSYETNYDDADETNNNRNSLTDLMNDQKIFTDEEVRRGIDHNDDDSEDVGYDDTLVVPRINNNIIPGRNNKH